jgi:putative membrane protein
MSETGSIHSRPVPSVRGFAAVRFAVSLAFVGGLGLFIALVAWQGFDQMLAALAVAGWGLVVVALFHWLPLFTESIAWWVLFRAPHQPTMLRTLWARWIGETVDTLLPAAHVGGDLVKAALLIRGGLPGPVVGATVVVDLTLTIVTQILFTVFGLTLLGFALGSGQIALTIVGAVVVTGILVAAFYRVQHRGLFGMAGRLLENLTRGRIWQDLSVSGEAMDQEVMSLYRDRGRALRCAVLLMLTWLIGAGEIWLAMVFLGFPISITDALIIESLIQATRSLVFLLPGAIGVQEGGFLLFGGLLGIPADLSLALALTRRFRELALGLPALLCWQFSEAHRIWLQRERAVE